MRGELGKEGNKITNIYSKTKKIRELSLQCKWHQPTVSAIPNCHSSFWFSCPSMAQQKQQSLQDHPTIIQLRRQHKTIFSVFNYFVIIACVIISTFVFAWVFQGWSKIKGFFWSFVLGHITSLQKYLINSFVHERTDRASFPKGPS